MGLRLFWANSFLILSIDVAIKTHKSSFCDCRLLPKKDFFLGFIRERAGVNPQYKIFSLRFRLPQRRMGKEMCNFRISPRERSECVLARFIFYLALPYKEINTNKT